MDSDITFIDSELYEAAAEGQIDPFNRHTEPLNLLLTPTKNTILHIHVYQQLKGAACSVSFTEQILAKCPSLLLQTNNRGETPLHIAARRGPNTIVQCLIDAAKAKHQDIETGAGAARTMLRMESIDKETALHEAVRHNNPTVVQILTEEDPDFTYSANRLGETPLYLAVERRYTKMAVQILDTCNSPDFRGPNGRTALHEVVIRNSLEMTTKIIEAKKTLAKEVDQQGWTPLHHASHFGHLSIVRKLLEHEKSAAYIGDKDGRTPLHLASASGDSHREVVFCIIKHCPDCHELVDHKGQNILHFAVQSRSGIMLNALFNVFNIKSVYFHSLIINQKDVDGNTPLHLLATYCLGNFSLIWHPLVDKMAVNNDNFTPLDIISKSADDDIIGFKGYTLKTMKKAGGYEESLRNLIEVKNKPPERIEMEEIERTKSTPLAIVSALIVTVTFTAGFTLPGGYDSNKGTAILSRNGAFVAFIIADALALLLSTCALFFYFVTELDVVTKRRKIWLITFAGLFLLLAIFMMLFAFTAAVFAVLLSTYLKVIICVIASLFVLICYSPIKDIVLLIK